MGAILVGVDSEHIKNMCAHIECWLSVRVGGERGDQTFSIGENIAQRHTKIQSFYMITGTGL